MIAANLDAVTSAYGYPLLKATSPIASVDRRASFALMKLCGPGEDRGAGCTGSLIIIKAAFDVPDAAGTSDSMIRSEGRGLLETSLKG